MNTYLFRTTVTPTTNDFYYDSNTVADFITNAETIADARKEYAEYVMNRYYIEISKSNQMRPQKMYRELSDGTHFQCGYVFRAKTEIDFRSGWKRRFVSLWTEIYEQVKF